MTTEILVEQSEFLASISEVDPIRVQDELPHVYRDALEAIAAGVDDSRTFARRILGLPLNDEVSAS